MNSRESDTMLWLHNKLGSSTDTWPEGSISTLLTTQMLKSIKNCFLLLETRVKLKLLLSFIHIPSDNLSECFAELNEILALAKTDSEPWVSVLGEILITFPTNEILNTNIKIGNNRHTFSLLVSDLKKLVDEHSDSDKFPLEWCYLNKNVLNSVADRPFLTPEHFSLRRKPKATVLKENLLQKSRRTASTRVNYGATFLRTDRKPDFNPSRYKPRFNPSSGISSMLSVKPKPDQKGSGIKLLDFKEQPLQRKKRKSLQEIERTQRTAELGSVPDYALGLNSVPFPQTLMHSSLFPQSLSRNSSPFPQNLKPNSSPFPQFLGPNSLLFSQSLGPNFSTFPQRLGPNSSLFPQSLTPNSLPFPQSLTPNPSTFPQNLTPSSSSFPQSLGPNFSTVPQNVRP